MNLDAPAYGIQCTRDKHLPRLWQTVGYEDQVEAGIEHTMMATPSHLH
jgi:hypothetical protein